MPIYEFQCRDCGRKMSTLVLSRARIDEVRCARCGSANLEKLFSRFATVKSEEARLNALADPSGMGDLDENDPKSVSRWMKKMGREMGDDLGEDFDAAVEEEMAAESGDGSTDTDGGNDDL